MQEFLDLYGWGPELESATDSESRANNWVRARVISEERSIYRLQTDIETSLWATVSGKLTHEAQGRAGFPAVGDWVWVEIPKLTERGTIHRLCPRRTVIYRKQVGSSVDIQILSTNVDFIFVTSSMNEDLNLRRLERYLIMASESGAKPVVVLTKSDLCEDVPAVVKSVQDTFVGVPVVTVSKTDQNHAAFFAKTLSKGSTSVFVGSSGVGKSTLVNFLIGGDQIKTQEVRAHDGRGRHTTTSRSLYVSRYGGLIIDTPGIRELQLSTHAEGLNTQFADVQELMARCRFTDCKHNTEPGCAIKASLSNGELLPARWQSYLKLEAEVLHGVIKKDKVAASGQRKVWKKRSDDAKVHKKTKREW